MLRDFVAYLCAIDSLIHHYSSPVLSIVWRTERNALYTVVSYAVCARYIWEFRVLVGRSKNAPCAPTKFSSHARTHAHAHRRRHRWSKLTIPYPLLPSSFLPVSNKKHLITCLQAQSHSTPSTASPSWTPALAPCASPSVHVHALVQISRPLIMSCSCQHVSHGHMVSVRLCVSGCWLASAIRKRKREPRSACPPAGRLVGLMAFFSFSFSSLFSFSSMSASASAYMRARSSRQVCKPVSMNLGPCVTVARRVAPRSIEVSQYQTTDGSADPHAQCICS